ncbi:MAG TPA: C25 family cysteine peptidase [Candidatus Saccharimonadaceae bacterium]|nr:C25 family cysteine peptidase [Candidatus Saccharimonadaceae bacterium]
MSYADHTTPGLSHLYEYQTTDAIALEPVAFDVGTYRDQIMFQVYGPNGFNYDYVGLGTTAEDVSALQVPTRVSWFDSLLTEGRGAYWLMTHGSGHNLYMECFPISQAGDAAYLSRLFVYRVMYDASWVDSTTQYYEAEPARAQYHVLMPTWNLIRNRYHDKRSFVHILGCNTYGLESAFQGVLKYLGYTGSVEIATALSDARFIYYSMVNGGQAHTLADGIEAAYESHHNLTMFEGGVGDSKDFVLAPTAVLAAEDSFPPISDGDGTDVEIRFDMPMFHSNIGTNVACTGPLMLDADRSYWTGNSLLLHLKAIGTGEGHVIIHGYDPTVQGRQDGLRSEYGAVALDGNTDPGAGHAAYGEEGHVPNRDDLDIPVCAGQDCDPRNDAAVEALHAFRADGTLGVSWSTGWEANVTAYLVEGAREKHGEYHVLKRVNAMDGVKHGYSVKMADPLTQFVRVRELETNGDTLFDMADSVVTAGGERAREASGETVSAAIYESAPKRWAAQIVAPDTAEWLCVAPDTWTTTAQTLADYWTAHGHPAAIVGLTTVGGVAGLRSYLAPLAAGRLRYVLLAGDANDYVPWTNAAVWSNGWTNPGWPTQQQYNILPLSTYIADPNPPGTSMSGFTPYWGSDWDYVDFNSDNVPDIAVGRAPVDNTDELSRFIAKTIAAASAPAWGGASNQVGVWTYARDNGYIRGDVAATFGDQLDGVLPAQITGDILVDNDATAMTDYSRREAAKAAMVAGRALIVISGTGSSYASWCSWLDQRSFAWSDIPSAQWSTLPFVMGAGCGLGDIDRTEDPTMGRPLLQQALSNASMGPWGGFGPTRGGWQRGHVEVGKEFLRALYGDSAMSAGDAARLAVEHIMASAPAYHDLARSYVFLGDPLVRIPGMGSSVTLAATVNSPAGPLTMCPSGDADTLAVSISLTPTNRVDLANPYLRAMVVKTTGAVTWWDSIAASNISSDTLYAGAYARATRQFQFRSARASGCGTVPLTVYVDGRPLAVGASVDVRTCDLDGTVRGAVDKDDVAAWYALWGMNSPCADIDRSGAVNGSDLVRLNSHLGHHIPGDVLSPNGGERYEQGTLLSTSWRPFSGDSAKVTISLLRTSQPGARYTLARDLPDNGAWAQWYIENAFPPASDYKLELIHTAGFFHHVPDSIWADRSDTTFTIALYSGGGGGGGGGNGCPFVDTRTDSGWAVENSILGRSLTGELGLDDYCLRNVPAVVDSMIQLRIRENEQEYTTLDEVRLIAIDHDPVFQAISVGDRVVLGHRVPAASVVTRSGLDITNLVNGSGSYFVGEAGETLHVALQMSRPMSATGMLRALGGGGFEIDPGDKGGEGGAPQASMGPATPTNVDEEVLEDTGILIEVPDSLGSWQTVEHVYPRDEFAPHTIDLPGVADARLVFLDRHKLRFVGAVEFEADSVLASKQSLVGASHSRLGDVMNAVGQSGNLSTSLAPGDTLDLSFRATSQPSGLVRDLFLLSRGVYTSNLPASQHPEVPETPMHFALQQNRPNPFNAHTTIGFDLPTPARVKLEIFDLQGRMIRRVADQAFGAGRWSIQWDRRDGNGGAVHPGVYLYRIQAGQFHDQKKMVLLP